MTSVYYVVQSYGVGWVVEARWIVTVVACNNFFPFFFLFFFFFQAEDGIRDAQESRGLGDVYKRQELHLLHGGKKIAVDVIDNGKGISKNNRKNIFRPGYSTKQRGWGLGLSLAMRIVKEYHRGQLFVLMSKPNEKTVMRIVLKNPQENLNRG